MTYINLDEKFVGKGSTLRELLEELNNHIQDRNREIDVVNAFVLKIKDGEKIVFNDLVQFREQVQILILNCTKINELCSYIKGFMACYDQIKPMLQEVEEISSLIDKQEEQLKVLSKTILDTG